MYVQKWNLGFKDILSFGCCSKQIEDFPFAPVRSQGFEPQRTCRLCMGIERIIRCDMIIGLDNATLPVTALRLCKMAIVFVPRYSCMSRTQILPQKSESVPSSKAYPQRTVSRSCSCFRSPDKRFAFPNTCEGATICFMVPIFCFMVPIFFFVQTSPLAKISLKQGLQSSQVLPFDAQFQQLSIRRYNDADKLGSSNRIILYQAQALKIKNLFYQFANGNFALSVVPRVPVLFPRFLSRFSPFLICVLFKKAFSIWASCFKKREISQKRTKNDTSHPLKRKMKNSHRLILRDQCARLSVLLQYLLNTDEDTDLGHPHSRFLCHPQHAPQSSRCLSILCEFWHNVARWGMSFSRILFEE